LACDETSAHAVRNVHIAAATGHASRRPEPIYQSATRHQVNIPQVRLSLRSCQDTLFRATMDDNVRYLFSSVKRKSRQTPEYPRRLWRGDVTSRQSASGVPEQSDEIAVVGPCG